MKKSNAKVFVFMFATICFSVFWFAKINGYFDFTGKYGIESIDSNIYPMNLPLILDGELLTDWGAEPGRENKIGDYLTITFKSLKVLKNLTMRSTDNKLPDSFLFMIKDKYGKWIVPPSLYYIGGKFSFDETELTSVRIEIANDATKFEWRISEVIINE